VRQMGFPFSTKASREEDKGVGAVGARGRHSIGFGKAAWSVVPGGDKRAGWRGQEWVPCAGCFPHRPQARLQQHGLVQISAVVAL
jgi:hypothetical protein